MSNILCTILDEVRRSTYFKIGRIVTGTITISIETTFKGNPLILKIGVKCKTLKLSLHFTTQVSPLTLFNQRLLITPLTPPSS